MTLKELLAGRSLSSVREDKEGNIVDPDGNIYRLGEQGLIVESPDDRATPVSPDIARDALSRIKAKDRDDFYNEMGQRYADKIRNAETEEERKRYERKLENVKRTYNSEL